MNDNTAAPQHGFPDSLWAATAGPLPRYGALDGPIDTEVVIVGGGFTGLHAGLALAERGTEAVILEARQPGWGASGRNGGQAIPGLHDSAAGITGKFGKERGLKWLRAGFDSAQNLFDLIRSHELSCDALQPGYLTLAHSRRALDRLAAECGDLNPHGARMCMIGEAETRRLTGSGAFPGAQITEAGGSVQPLKLCIELARRCAELGCRVHGDTAVTSVRHDGTNWILETPEGPVTAKGLVLASNTYTDGLFGSIDRGYVKVCSFQVSTVPLGEEARHIFPEGHAAADTRRLLHYFRRSPDGRLVMGGRAPFRTDVTLDDAASLRAGIAMIYPELADVQLEHCWAGWVGFTTNHLPVLTSLGPRGFAVYGYNASGVALSSLLGSDAGRLAAGDAPESVATPVAPARPVPFHRFSRLGARIAIRGFAVLDRLGL